MLDGDMDSEIMTEASSYSTLIGAGCHITCIDVNTDATKVLIGGRQVLKVMRMAGDRFNDICNLHTREMIGLSYSITDVAWNHNKDSIVASAATNGDVVIWDLNVSGHNKQDRVYSHQLRTCNRISFHCVDPDILITGCQDGTITLLDLRLRQNEGNAVRLFGQDSDSAIRDVQINPHNTQCFATACEDGSIKLWDVRMPHRCQTNFNAHYGPAFCLDFHSYEPWLATGGRDKMIRVYDITLDSRHIDIPIYTVQSIAPTARVKWRPKRPYHLASCSQLLDFSLRVWDIRRPYIPFAMFTTHRDIVTGVVWRGVDPHCILTCGRDGNVFMHSFSDAERPVSKISPVALSIGAYGHVGHAFTKSLSNGHQPSIMESFFQKPPEITTDRATQALGMSSHLCVYRTDMDQHATSMNSFIEMACCYRLSGEPVSTMCEHNAGVASRLKCSDIAQTWRMLYYMCTTQLPPAVPTSATSLPMITTENVVDNMSSGDPVLFETAEPQLELLSSQKLTDIAASVSDEDDHSAGDDTSTIFTLDSQRHMGKRNPLFGGPPAALQQALRRHDSLTDVMNDNAYLSVALNSDITATDPYKDLWQMQSEPIGSLYPVADGDVILNTPPDSDDEASVHPLFGREWLNDMQQTFSAEWVSEFGNPSGFGDEWITETRDTTIDEESNQPEVIREVEVIECAIKQEILNTSPYNETVVPGLDFTQLIVDMIHQYAAQNDVQTAVSVLLCLGEKFIHLIDERNLEQWFLSYVEMLHVFELWPIAAEIIKQSSAIPEVHALSCISTRIITSCSRCLRMLTRIGWLCDRCNNHIYKCSICHLPVRGMYVWCQGCSHGGHLDHITRWFKTKKLCPTGCGHKCEYV